jgi:Ca2+-binding RTX toxin-like protein
LKVRAPGGGLGNDNSSGGSGRDFMSGGQGDDVQAGGDDRDRIKVRDGEVTV